MPTAREVQLNNIQDQEEFRIEVKERLDRIESLLNELSILIPKSKKVKKEKK
jgi:hypothetical protein